MAGIKYYSSPRWTGEILDCSMPVTLDTYSCCSFNCLYCFSFFQKSHGRGENKKNDYQNKQVTHINTEKIKNLVNCELKTKEGAEFEYWFKNKKVIQWGGLADQFDNNEKKYNITLELLKFFKEKNYPISFSTKATWWLDDDRYIKLFKDQNNWNCKFSIINLDSEKAKKMELGVPSPIERFNAIKKYSNLNSGGATLRLRPFIIGLSDYKDEYLEMIKLAKDNGATAVSTEFFCLEMRADERLKERYKKMSNILGYDIYDFYKRYSNTNGYLRLNKNIKYKYIKNMKELCDKLNLRFYVSDAHFKEYCNNGSCCGLDESWNYSRGQFTQILLLAKQKGKVYFDDLEKNILYLKDIPWDCHGFNSNSAKLRVIRKNQTMFDYFREIWNSPNSAKSPYKYFNGILKPIGTDNNNNVIYEYNETDR